MAPADGVAARGLWRVARTLPTSPMPTSLSMLSTPIPATSVPSVPMPAMPPTDDLADCQAMLRNGSRTFLAASLLLPRSVREPACALYAFCRLADDAVDGDAADAGAVARLHQRLDRIYAGRPEAHPADRALAVVVERFAIPRALPDALLEGFAWDAAGRRYDTLAELHDYAARVAGAVGAMMALVMRVRSADAVARACDLGVAMQLSNIARDVGEDARRGRLYLPRAWLREAGIDPDAWLAAPVFNEALASVVRRLLDEADRLYARVDAGVAQLPLACQPGINAARFLYAGIGHEVARRGFDSISQRAVVPRRRKLRLLLRSMWLLSSRRDAGRAAAALPATRHLVDAVQGSVGTRGAIAGPANFGPSNAAAAPRWWDIQSRALWVIDLFERLERQDRHGRSSSLAPLGRGPG